MKKIESVTPNSDEEDNKKEENNKKDEGIGTTAKTLIGTIILGIPGGLLYYFKRKINKIQDVDGNQTATIETNPTTVHANPTPVIEENNR